MVGMEKKGEGDERRKLEDVVSKLNELGFETFSPELRDGARINFEKASTNWVVAVSQNELKYSTQTDLEKL